MLEEGYAITGLALLCVRDGEEFNVPGEAVAMLSKTLLDAGDAVTVLAA